MRDESFRLYSILLHFTGKQAYLCMHATLRLKHHLGSTPPKKPSPPPRDQSPVRIQPGVRVVEVIFE